MLGGGQKLNKAIIHICLLFIFTILPAAAYANHFPSPNINTPNAAAFLVNLKIGGLAAAPGDEVAFFDPQGIICGRYIVTAPQEYFPLAVYGDDADTGAIDEGAVSGDNLTVKVWHAASGREFSGSALVLTGGSLQSGYYLPSPIPPVWGNNVGYVLDIDVLTVSSGDVDGNGRVDLADAILALQICAGFPTADPRLSSDVSSDMKIGLQEVIYILQKTGQLR